MPSLEGGRSDDAIQAIKDGLKRIRNSGGKDRSKMVVKEIAERVGCSLPTIHAWSKGNVKIRREDAISLALLDPGIDSTFTEEMRVAHWLQNCGYQIPDRDQIKREIKERTSLSAKLKRKITEIKELARAKNIVSDEEFNLALSCKLGQEKHFADVKEWLRQTNGKGTVAFIWRCCTTTAPKSTGIATQESPTLLTLDELCERLKTQQVIKDAVLMFLKPSKEIMDDWPSNSDLEIKVHGFIQININSSAPEKEKPIKVLKDAVKEFLKGLDLGTSQNRVKIFTTTTQYPHPADCWVYASSTDTFAVLVSESSHLVRKLERSTDLEIKNNPYGWSGQIIQLRGSKVINNDYLAGEKISLADGKVSPAESSGWIPLMSSSTTRNTR